MKQQFINILLTIIIITITTGCSSKQDQEYNKPATYWYNKMIKQIANFRLDEADDTYTSLESEHRNSPLLPSAILIIANAHMDDEEYAMANYYLDQYLKRFSLKKDVDYINFLKVKSNFLAFKNQYREQELLSQTIKQCDKFIAKFPHSSYIYLVGDIKSRLLMTSSLFEKEIAGLYGRVEKPKAKIFYNNKAKTKWKKIDDIQDIDIPWYRYLFE